MQLTQAIDGFLLFKAAAGLRPRTLQLYRHYLTQFTRWHGDRPLDGLSADDINRFLVYLRNDYRPIRKDGSTRPLSSQSIYNTWTALKAFTRWAHETLDMADIMTGQVPRPKAQNDEQTPFTQDEVKHLLAAVKPQKTTRATSGLYYLTDLRDKAIILTLLDTGIRAGELCRLVIADAHLQNGRLDIQHGKGGKSRHVWIGAHTRPAVWRYLQERTPDPAAPLFASSTGHALTMSALRKRLVAIGLRAGIPDANPHRYRYTFAIQYLRNGGDVFTLQALLGHTTMAMVQRYLKLAAADVEDAHRRASPVDRWLK